MTLTASAPPGSILSVRGATKRFGAVLAVDDVSLDLGHGEILALLGDNGAGKSTLIKCISGVHRLDRGALEIDGATVAIRTPHDARRYGVETVYQDLALFDDLDVVANLFAGRELGAPHRPAWVGWMRRRRMRDAARETLERLQVDVPSLRTPVKLMSGGQRQAVAVARAVLFAARIVILDEPTAALGVRESRNLLRLIKTLPPLGVSVIMVSHNLDQVSEVADRAVVMRRGRVVGEAVPNAAGAEQMMRLIVGAEHGTAPSPEPFTDPTARAKGRP